jgi:CARDB
MSTVTFEYAAKFICGLQKDPEDLRLTRGLYGTEINVHNPNEHVVGLAKKLALTFPPGDQQPGKILRLGEDRLRPDQALEVDCNHVRRKLFPNGLPGPYITGFIVIESQASLDVTAVYTTAALDESGEVTSQRGIDVEQIREREKRGLPEFADLIPVPDEQGSFCNRENDKLIVTVRNQGVATAGPSTTQVDFFGHGLTSLPTPSLVPGQSTTLAFPIPSGCFDPDCEFRITVDAGNAVIESNEANNTADGVCLG